MKKKRNFIQNHVEYREKAIPDRSILPNRAPSSLFSYPQPKKKKKNPATVPIILFFQFIYLYIYLRLVSIKIHSSL